MCMLQKNLIKKVNNNVYLNLKELLSHPTKIFKCFCPYQSCYNFDPRGLIFFKKGKISTQKAKLQKALKHVGVSVLIVEVELARSFKCQQMKEGGLVGK